MLSRLYRFAILAVALATPAAYAAPLKTESTKGGPAVLVKVQSVNNLFKSAEYIATLLPDDTAEQFKQGIRTVKDLIDDKKGLGGIDVTQPIGMYVTFGEELGPTPPVVVLIPVADEQAVLDTLENTAKLKVTKEKDGVYSTQPEQSPFPIYFRFANKYAYVTLQDAANIDTKTLVKPADVLGGKDEHLVSATVRIDRMPKDMKNLAIAAIETQLAAGKDQPIPNETKAMKEFKEKTIDELTANIKELLESGEEASLHLNVDPKAQEVAVEIEMSGVKGSKLAKDIKSIRDNKSVVGGAIASPDTAFSLTLSAGLPGNLKKLFPAVVDDAKAELLKQVNVPGEILTKAEPLIKALLPTVKAGEIDVGVSLMGPDKNDKYTGIAGLKLVDGKKVEEAIKTLVKNELPPEVSGLIQLDAEKLAGGSMLHIVKVGDQLDENGQKVFGKSDIYLSFRDDLLVIAMGPDAKKALNKAIASKPADVGVLHAQVNLARIVPLMGENNAKELEAAKKAADKIFGKGTGAKADMLKFSIDGGDTLKIKLAAQGKAIQFLAEMAGAKKDN
ncbi:MAG TPA: hypothetical protein VHR66_09530 [Gemmataceae bacterium]|jgi:hypothetical protein|nr:hypothetical protein [Gemmataceae bacterium]